MHFALLRIRAWGELLKFCKNQNLGKFNLWEILNIFVWTKTFEVLQCVNYRYTQNEYLFFRWACGTKNLLSKLEEGLIPKAKSHDILEEIQKYESSEQLENDEDVFDEKNTKSVKWKFVGDCAYMVGDEEIQEQQLTSSPQPNRKR